MRICLIPTPDLEYPSGSTLHAQRLATTMAAMGHDIEMFCLSCPAIDFENLAVHRLAIQLPHPVMVDPIPSAAELEGSVLPLQRALLERHNYRPFDVIHSHYAGFTALSGMILSLLTTTPHVTSIFGRDLNVGVRLDKRYEKMMQAILAVADHIIVPNSQVAADLSKFDGHNCLSIIPMGIDLDIFDGLPSKINARNILNIPFNDDKVIVSVQSNLSIDKGGDVLIYALGSVAGEIPEVRLLMVGGDDTPDGSNLMRLQELAINCGVSEKISWIGRVEHRDIPKYLAASDVFVDPRLTSSESSSLLEAAVAGCTLVYSDSIGLPMRFRSLSRSMKLSFDTGSTQSLARQITRGLRRGRKHSGINRSVALRNLGDLLPDKIATATMDVYNRVVNPGRD